MVIHALSIGDYCLVGNNSTLLEDVEIGDYCIVAANAVVLGGTKVPDGSLLTGVPARIRPLTPEQILKLEHTADDIFNSAAGYPDYNVGR